jgi:hypothetical protein
MSRTYRSRGAAAFGVPLKENVSPDCVITSGSGSPKTPFSLGCMAAVTEWKAIG